MMNQSMKRNKINLLNRRNSIEQDNELYKTMRTNSSKIPIPFASSSDETKKLIEKLQKVAKEEKQKRQDTEIKYEQFKERVVNRERQFYRILSKFDAHLPSESKEENYENYVNEIYKKILCTFEAFNQKARSLLDDRYSELYRLMQRRIDILMQKMDKQLAKYRKVSLTERKEIQQAIKQIGVIAAQTQNENLEFRKKNEYMELKLRILNDEKRLLLEEITSIKAYIKDNLNKGEKKGKFKETVQKDDFWNKIESVQIQRGKDTKANHRRTLTSRQYRYETNVSLNSQNKKNRNPQNKIDIFKLQQQSISQQNIILHLKQQLTREKNKNFQLIKFSLQLQAKQQKIRELIGIQIKSIVTRASQNSLADSMIQKKIKKDRESFSEFNGSQDRFIVDVNKKFQKPNHLLDIKNINLTLEEAQKQIFEEKTKFSTLVSEINKILQLPQIQKNEGKIQIDKMDRQISSKQNPQILRQNNKKVQKKGTSANKNPTIQLNLVSSKEAGQHDQSVTRHYGSISRYKQTISLFANYSPLDIMDITKSIEIN